MQVIRSIRAALLLVVLTGVALVGLGATAHAAPTSTEAASTCVRPEPRGDDQIHVLGCLEDRRVDPAVPVPGVEVSVSDDEGNEVATGTTDDTGLFDIAIGPAIDVLGNDYVVSIDEETLPEGTELRNPEQQELTLNFKLQADRFVTFPIGEAEGGTGLLSRALQLAVGGIVFAVLLSLASLGLSLVFGTTGLTNFAHGELITFGAIMAFVIDGMAGDVVLFGMNVTMVVAIIFATVMSVLFGWAQDKILWKPLRKKGVGLIAAMIVSIGLGIFLRNIYQRFVGADNRNYSQWTSPTPWEIGPLSITPKEVGVVVAASIVLLVVTWAIRTTRIGKATRAVADNPALASASGINVDRVISAVWATGAGLAGLSGVLLGMTQGYDYQLGYKILLLVFAAVVLGGLGSVWGALAGSFLIGIFIEVSTLFIPAELKFAGALLVLILVLLVRPQGLFGRAERIG